MNHALSIPLFPKDCIRGTICKKGYSLYLHDFREKEKTKIEVDQCRVETYYL
jgi:hypothetical protein